MQDEVTQAFRDAINRALPIAQKLVGQSIEPHLVWRKSDNGGWQGEYEQRQSLIGIFIHGEPAFEEIGKNFRDVFLRHHPEYRGMFGFSTMRTSVLRDSTHILRAALATLWERHGSFNVPPDAIETILNEFAEFVDQSTVRFRFQAPLLNFRTCVERIEFPAGLRIRRLSEEEVSDIHGGPVFRIGPSPHFGFGMIEFAIEGEYEEPKVFGELENQTSPAEESVRPSLDKAILALRTFKEGRVGYESVKFKTVNFCPLPGESALAYGDLHVPHGVYDLTGEEIEPLRKHAIRIFAFSEPVMEMACARLSDSQTRLHPQDRLIDAVIGLEALLLAGLRSEDRRGELRYRFALNYSTLFATPEERYRAFRVARDLYDLRSRVAHGGIVKGKTFPVGVEQLNLGDGATRACDVLRRVVNHFLPVANTAPYKKSEFWERSYFGLTST